MLKPVFKIFLFCFLCFTFHLRGQFNVVPNPGFEQLDSCPQTADKVKLLKNWFKASGSPELNNKCSSSIYSSLPKNYVGYQQNPDPLCNSYIGEYSGGFGSLNYYRELVGVKLSDSLLMGQKYFFSMHISLADTSQSAINNMGMKLTYGMPQFDINGDLAYLLVDNSAKIYSSTVDTAHVTWRRIKGKFVADSNYKYLFLGNFFDSPSTTSQFVYPSSGFYGAYYYIDDICLSTDSNLCYSFVNHLNTVKEIYENNSFLKVFPNPASDNVYIENSFSEKATLEIVNMGGVTLSTYNLQMGTTKINISHLEDGAYIMILSSATSSIRKKLFINH